MKLLKNLSESWNVNNVRKEIPELRSLTNNEIAQYYAKALIIDRRKKLANAKVSDCLVNCSEDFNIAQETTYNAALVGAASCGLGAASLLGSSACGALVVAAYEVASNGELQKLGACANRCMQ